MTDDGGRLRPAHAVAWGVFLASSWTWVIGMWLPVLLVGDFGWPGWLVFVVPNVLGAMAMGLMLRAPRESPALIASHPGAMRWFSIVTVLFHVSFLAWWLGWAAIGMSISGWAGVAVAAALIIAAGLSARGGSWPARAIAVYVLSLGAWLAASITGSTLRLAPIGGERPFQDLLWAAPVICFGFALCPYLDLTFHRARQSCAGRTGDAAFVWGFGLFFLAMMVYSLLYAGGFRSEGWSLYLVIHIAAQSWFTMSAHLRELFARDGLGASERRQWGRGVQAKGVLALVIAAFALGAGALTLIPRLHPEMATNTLLYYLFLGAYALPFPAYVWIVMIERGASGSRRMVVWAVATALAAPCLWLGFVEGGYAWLAPAAGIVLLAPLAARGAAKGDADGVERARPAP